MTLLRSKLTPPRLRPSLVERADLIARLNQGLNGDVTLISAPAGYGKTTLVADWVGQAPLPVAWLSLDETDNELAGFFTYLIAAIRTLFPEACPTSFALVRGSQPAEGELLPTILVNEIDDLPQRFALVLDDYHFISDASIRQLMDTVLRRPPIQMHLILLSRAEPYLTLGRLRANGMLNEFSLRDLRMTPIESKTLLNQMSGSLDEKVSLLLSQRAEGWVTGLHLASLTLRSFPDPAAVVGSLMGDNNRYVVDYLFEQVLNQHSAEVREFLAKTAILNRISPGLARAVIGPGAAMPTTLVEIERAGLFLTALDSSGEWFVYHMLFRQVLEKLLRETYPPEEIATLHLRACEWFTQRNFIDEALDHALAAGDTSLAAHIVNAQVTFYLNTEGWPILERWWDRLPEEVVARQPLLLVAKAYILTYRLQWNAVLPYLTQAEELLSARRPDDDSEEVAVARALLAWVWAYHWLGELEPEKTRTAAEQARSLLPDNYPVLATLITHVLTVALQWLKEFELAEQMVNDTLARITSTSPYPQTILGPLLALTTLNLAEGLLVKSEQAALMLLQKSEQLGAENMKTWAYLSLGAAAYYANELPAALAHYSEGVQLRYGSNVLASDQCLVGLALTYQALGQADEARGVLAIMRDFHQELASTLLNVEYRSLQARIALMNGDVTTARQWSSDTSSDAGLALGWIIVPAITNLRISLSDNPSPADIEEVLAELDRLLAKLTQLHQPNRQVELLSLRALALDARGDRQAAVNCLAEALALAEPRGLVRPVVDAGRQLEPLLEALAVRRPSAYMTRLLAAIRPAAAPAARAGQPMPRLTPREREVLVLLSQYYTDRLIAETLVVSPLTVRTHIENLAEKLGVRGRRTIVDRARELALLP